MPYADHNCSICGQPCDCMDFMFDDEEVDYGDAIGTDYYDCIDCTDCDCQQYRPVRAEGTK